MIAEVPPIARILELEGLHVSARNRHDYMIYFICKRRPVQKMAGFFFKTGRINRIQKKKKHELSIYFLANAAEWGTTILPPLSNSVLSSDPEFIEIPPIYLYPELIIPCPGSS